MAAATRRLLFTGRCVSRVDGLVLVARAAWCCLSACDGVIT